MSTTAKLLDTDKGRAQMWQQINENEAHSTFLSSCIRCRGRTPHRILNIGRFVTWQCQMCGFPNDEQKAA